MEKIVQLIHGLNTGGAETLVKNYCLGLDKSKYDVTVLCYERLDSPYDKILTDAGIKVLYACDLMKFGGKRNIVAKVINYCQGFGIIREMLRELKPDILHTHLPLNSYVKFAGLPQNTRIFHTIHSQIDKLWFCNSFERKKDLKAAKWLVKHRGMRMIVLYDDMKREADKLFKVSNSVVLNNGIDFEVFQCAKDRDTMRIELKIPQDAFVIGHVGRFSPVKNHNFLVDVFKEICRHNDKAFLLMVGDGDEVELVKKRLNVASLDKRFLLLSNRSDVADIMNAMDVFVFPSIYEGLGLAVIEAQKSGLPCIVSNSVPDAVRVTNLVKMLPLSEGVEHWAGEVLNYRQIKSEAIESGKYDVPQEWDMKEVVRRLEQIYDGEV